MIQNHIHVEPEWIPRELNQQANYLSHVIDYDDWQLNPIIFAELDSLWGPHTVDCFATHYHALLPRFNSRYWCPGTEAVEAFTVNWFCNWLCPPTMLVTRVIHHVQVCRAKATLIVPAWPSAAFWPILCPAGREFAYFVVEAYMYELPSIELLFLPSQSGAVLFGGKIPNTAVLALRCEF